MLSKVSEENQSPSSEEQFQVYIDYYTHTLPPDQKLQATGDFTY